MQIFNSSQRYGTVAKSLHWLTVIAVSLAWFLGTFDDIFPKGPARASAFAAHVFAGLSFLAILALRLPWRLFDRPPAPEVSGPGGWIDRIGGYAHLMLYGLLILAPVSGVVLQFARGDALPVFGFFEIASPWPADRAFSRNVKNLHEVLTNGLVILAGLHIAAALMHHWILRDNTLRRMIPGLGGRQ